MANGLTGADGAEDGAGNGAGTAKIILATAGQSFIALPASDLVTDAALVRDGQDLVLRTADGRETVIEGYFSAEPTPLLTAPNGTVLTPDLVNSFMVHDGPLQYAARSTASDESPVGAISEIHGTATVTRTDGTTEPLNIGSPVYEGDIIETDAAGGVNVEFIDESSFAVSGNARLAIDEYVFDPSTQGGATDFSLLRGVFVFTSGLIGREDPDDVHINTPIGSIGIRGTVIAGDINPDGPSQITVVEGAIVIENAGGSVTLAEQYETARLSGYDAPIELVGVLPQTAVAESYNVLRVVAPEFFTSLGDAGEPVPSGEDSPGQAPLPTPEDGALPPPPADAAPLPPPEGALFMPPPPPGTLDWFMLDGTVQTFMPEGDMLFMPLLPPPPPPGDGTLAFAPPPPPPSGNNFMFMPPPPPPPPPGAFTPPPPPPAGPTILDLEALNAADGYVIAGAAGEKLGRHLAAMGDRDGNGLDDFAFSNDKASSGQVYKVMSGAGPSTFIPAPAPDTSRLSIRNIGDFDGDGQIDFSVTTPLDDTGAPDGGGGQIINGVNDPLLLTTTTNARLGHSVSGIGDINGDGYSDMLIGAPGPLGAGPNNAYVLFGQGSPPASYNVNSLGGGGFSMTAGASAQTGRDVSGAGDFNNDGYSDFIVTAPGLGIPTVFIGFGASTITGLALGSGTTMTVTGIQPDTDNEIPVSHLGDFNGDGISDIVVGSPGSDGGQGFVHILFGNPAHAIASTIDVSSGIASAAGITFKLPSASGSTFESGGDAGDFNADGFSDLALAIRTGDMIDIYVVYGKPGMTGTITVDSTFLDNPVNAFHMIYDLQGEGLANPATDPFDLEIVSGGDLDGDGFGDLLIGAAHANGGNGEVIAVYGRTETLAGYHIAGITTAMPDVFANGNNQSVVGSAGNNVLSNFNAGTNTAYNGASFSGGAGNDTINLHGPSFRHIDGGTGMDTLNFVGVSQTLDFAALGSEKLAGIETIRMMDNGQTLRLGLDDVFSLLQNSADNKLRIVEGGAGITTAFQINDHGRAGSTLTTAGFTANGTTNLGGVNYNVWDFGSGYQLLIDQNINAVSVT